MPGPRGGEIVVGVGDCRVAAAPSSAISTYALGSCLAVMVYDWKLKVGGLLHVMLPDSSIDKARAQTNPFVYVDTGIPELFRRLEEKGSSKNRVRCCIAGGASMMADSSHFEIGKRNYLALKKAFWKMGIFADREDVGGSESRSVRLDLANGQIEMKKGAGQERIFVPAGINLTGRTANDAGIAR